MTARRKGQTCWTTLEPSCISLTFPCNFLFFCCCSRLASQSPNIFIRTDTDISASRDYSSGNISDLQTPTYGFNLRGGGKRRRQEQVLDGLVGVGVGAGAGI